MTFNLRRRFEKLEREIAPPGRKFCLFDPRPYQHFDLEAELQRLHDEYGMTDADELRIVRWLGQDEEAALDEEARPCRQALSVRTNEA
jgi:hypothetical protein